MLGPGARLVTCGNSNHNFAVHPPALLPTRCDDIISWHCAAVISWFAAFCFGLVCHSCFLPRYLACRAGFDLGLMSLLPVLRVCVLCMPACTVCMGVLYSNTLCTERSCGL